METQVSMSLSIITEWERLDNGPPEERACFAAIGIFAGEISLTQAEDAFVKRLRSSVHLSAYKLAEWFAWNWWRHRWEPSNSGSDWLMAHHMGAIGGGFIWPNIRVISDGEQIKLVTQPTNPSPTEPIRYLTELNSVFRAVEFEGAVSRFIEQVQGQLRAENVEETNLDRVWVEVRNERADKDEAKRRRLEALLGFDPDHADAALLDRLVEEAKELGEGAVRELAAMSSGRGNVLTADQLNAIADEIGLETRPRDGVHLEHRAQLSTIGKVPAWKRGAEAAQAVRAQEHMDGNPISNRRLAEMAGTRAEILDRKADKPDLSFVIDNEGNASRVVLRPNWETSRRFDLARLLGDRIAAGESGRLLPATRAYTYRQKLQRSFAAEFLCPFVALDDWLDGDYSPERQDDVAGHFNVSPLTVRTLLVNHGRIDRDELDGDYEAVSIN